MTSIDILFILGSGLLAGAIIALAGGVPIFAFLSLVAIKLPPVTAHATSAFFDTQVF